MSNPFDSQKLMERFFRRVTNVSWDLMTGKIGIITEEGIATIEGEGDDAQISINPIEQFGMAVPAFAQNTPFEQVQIGDLINAKTITGWVIEKKEKSFTLLKANGTRTSWSPPKVQMFDAASGVMVVRSLLSILPGGSAGLGGMQSMMMPMMMMGGDMDMEQMMPMMLMSQMGSITTADGEAPNPMVGMGGNMMQTMMMMQMMGGKKGKGTGKSPFSFFDADEE